MTVTDELYEISLKKAKSVVWVLSDLQQSVYTDMKRCLALCIILLPRLRKVREGKRIRGKCAEGACPIVKISGK